MNTFKISVAAAIAALCGASAWAQTNNISSVGITSGVVTVTARIGPNSQPPGPPNNSSLLVGNNLAGLAYAAGNIPGAAATSISFFTLTGAALPGGAGNPLDAFMSYGAIIGPPAAVLNYPDVAPLLTANTYLGLTFAATNLYPGGPAPLTANGFYTIHRNLTNGTDYLAGIVPATGGGSAVLNIKPMAWTGGVAATGASVVAGTNNYFALTFAVPTPAGPYFGNSFYYLRTDASSHTQFGYVIPALTSGFSDTLDLNTAVGGFGATGYTTLAFSATSFGGYPVNQFYYLRLDSATGNTILGRLDTNPANRTLSDIANLGGVYSGLVFAAEATGTGAGWGTNQLYATGTRALTAQSVSFAAIADRTFLGDVPFIVTPTASSGLDLVVTVVSGPATVATTGPALARVFTVTTTGPGVVKLRATQSGPGFITNWLDQSFNVLGLPAITSAGTASATVGTPFTFNITASGNPILSYAATGLPANGLTFNTTTGAITGTPLAAGTINVTGITATNATGVSTPGASLQITVGAAVPLVSIPSITNSPLSASGVVGRPFSYAISASDSPTSFTAGPLPAGLSLNATNGFITGTPTTVGSKSLQLGATNGAGTGIANFSINITAAAIAPVITLQPVALTGPVGQSGTFTVAGGGGGDPAQTILWQRLPAGSSTWLNLFEGGNYHGVSTPTLTVNPTTAAMSGDTFRAVIVNATDFTVSDSVTLTVSGASSVLIQYPAGIARDSAGNLYVTDTQGQTIKKITAAGVLSTLAGATGVAGSLDGTGDAARFNGPDGVTLDAAGNLYVTDSGNATIRKITPAGVVTTLAGTANVAGSSDATGGAASFSFPTGIAADAAGNLYVADTGNSTIRKITPAGVVTTFAGVAGSRGTTDGAANVARFNSPRGVTVDAAGNVYVAGTNSATIRKISPLGVVSTMAGSPGVTGTADGLGATALFNQPYGVAVDTAGNVYVADTGNDTIRVVTPGGAVATLVGTPGVAGLNEGPGNTALFNLPHGLLVTAGSLYVADTGNSTIRLVSPTDVVSTPAMTTGSTTTTPPPSGGTTTPVATPANSGGGGGGAVSPWFLVLLALLGATRLRSLSVRRSRTL